MNTRTLVIAAIAFLLAPGLAHAQPDTVAKVPRSSFADRPPCNADREGWRWTVIDCADETCASGGGSIAVGFDCRGGAWQIPGSGSGGGSSAGPDNAIQLSDGSGGLKAGPLIGTIDEWGLVGTTSTEATWDRICSATSVEFAEPADGGPWRDYYFDPTTGNDTTGDGSAAAPWQTPARMRELIAQVGCGVRINITGGSSYSVTDDASSFDSMNPICANEDGVGVWIRPTTSDAVTLACSGTGPADAVIGADGTDVKTAWTLVENLIPTGCETDLADAAGLGKLLYFLPPNSPDLAVTGANDNLVTSHQQSQIVAIGVSGTANGGASIAQAVAPVGESSAIVACSRGLSTIGTVDADVIAASSGGTGENSPTFIGERLVISGTGGSGNRTALEVNTVGAGIARGLLFRSLVRDFSTTQPAMRVMADAAGQTATLGLYGVTCSGLSSGAHCIDNAVDTPNTSTLSITARGLVSDEVTSRILNLVSGATSAGTVSVDIQESVWDDDDSTTSFRVGGVDFATRDLAAASPQAAGFDLFTTSTEISSGVQWNVTFDDAMRSCAVGRECRGRFSTPVDVPYDNHAGTDTPICIPESIAPGRICARRIGGDGAHAGWR